MLIKLTLFTNKQVIYIRATDVLMVTRQPANQLATLVTTTLQTPKGLLMHEVLDSPETIVAAVNQALTGKAASETGGAK